MAGLRLTEHLSTWALFATLVLVKLCVGRG